MATSGHTVKGGAWLIEQTAPSAVMTVRRVVTHPPGTNRPPESRVLAPTMK